jgi:hypothetical protein
MAYWREYTNPDGRSIYEENVCPNADALTDQPQIEGREVLVLTSIWLPWPKLSGVWKLENGSWVRTLSLADLGKIEQEMPQGGNPE